MYEPFRDSKSRKYQLVLMMTKAGASVSVLRQALGDVSSEYVRQARRIMQQNDPDCFLNEAPKLYTVRDIVKATATPGRSVSRSLVSGLIKQGKITPTRRGILPRDVKPGLGVTPEHLFSLVRFDEAVQYIRFGTCEACKEPFERGSMQKRFCERDECLRSRGRQRHNAWYRNQRKTKPKTT